MITGAEAAKIVTDYLVTMPWISHRRNAINIIHQLHLAGVRFAFPFADYPAAPKEAIATPGCQMGDLVVRLREAKRVAPGWKSYESNPLCQEAADEIEKLRAQLSRHADGGHS